MTEHITHNAQPETPLYKVLMSFFKLRLKLLDDLGV